MQNPALIEIADGRENLKHLATRVSRKARNSDAVILGETLHPASVDLIQKILNKKKSAHSL